MNAFPALLTQINAYLDAAPASASEVETAGPFRLYFRRDTAMPELSYARPQGTLSGDLSSPIAEVRAAFARRGRVCRWEFLKELSPGFAETLEQNGFPPSMPRPLMVVTPDTFTPDTFTPASAPNAEIRKAHSGESREIGRAVGRAFSEQDEEPGAAAEEDGSVDSMASLIDQGASLYGAYLDGRAVGGGLHYPLAETTEIAGVGVLPRFRRQGIASALTSALIADAFKRGCGCVFLSAADEEVGGIYARVGFRRVGTAMDTMEGLNG